jgi:MFS transporter, PHS family, inorganic phosphate transporter
MEYLICACVQVAFYGLGLNSSKILTSALLTRAGIGENIDPSELSTSLGVYKSLRNIAEGSLVVSVAGLLPGYYMSMLTIDFLGRKRIQYMGFAFLTVLLAVLGKAMIHLKPFTKFIRVLQIAGLYPGADPEFHLRSRAVAFFALYCLANFFANFGPNVTTFIVPGELFPTRYRCTAHGIAAASGKFGAIISQIIFYKVHESDTALKAM